jgi:K+-transporting ATPase ATPase C chain
VTASGSSLDPDISPEAALYQVPRVAKARHIPEEQIEALVKRSIKPCTFGIFGNPRVNVMLLNHELDKLS